MTSGGNLEHWESLAAFHGTGDDDYYDIPALVSGRTQLRDVERAAVSAAVPGAQVTGLRIAHVQSHIGIDSINLARLGAHVTAFDFSPMALSRLAEIAEECDVSVQTVEADSQRLADPVYSAHHGAYDIAYATIGVLGWIADVDAWMRGVSALLRPGGHLVLVEIHPLLSMPETLDPLVLDFPYRNDGVRHFEGTGSYANPDADITWSVDEYAWSVGEVVSAALRAGLRLTYLEEHTAVPFDPRGGILTQEPDGMFRWRLGSGSGGQAAEALPVLYTLVAERSPSGTLSEDEPAG